MSQSTPVLDNASQAALMRQSVAVSARSNWVQSVDMSNTDVTLPDDGTVIATRKILPGLGTVLALEVVATADPGSATPAVKLAFLDANGVPSQPLASDQDPSSFIQFSSWTKVGASKWVSAPRVVDLLGNSGICTITVTTPLASAHLYCKII